MWFKLAAANFSAKNLGKMADISNSYSINYNISGFAKTTAPTSVEKGKTISEITLTLQENYEMTGTATLTYGATSLNATVSGSTYKWTNITPTGSVTITAKATWVGSGEEPDNGGSGGDSSGGGGGTTTPTTPQVRYQGTSTSWSVANTASCYEVCTINSGEVLSSIVQFAGTAGVTPKLILLDANNKVVYTHTMTANTGSETATQINYTATQDLTLWVGGVIGSMGYKTGTSTGSTGDMNYVDFSEVGTTVSPTTSKTEIAFSLIVNVLV